MTGLAEAAASGDRLSALRSLRDVIAEAIAGTPPARDLAALSGRLQAVLAEIAELDPSRPEVDVVDEIAQRRSSRRAVAPKGSARSKRSS